MKKDIISSAIGILVLTLLLGVLYPLLVTGVSQVAFPGNANGQKVYVGGKLVGSKIIGQGFTDQVVKNGKPQVDKSGNPVTTPDRRYFQSRPSATVPAYNAAGTAFSNVGPNNIATEQAIASNIQAYLSLEKPYDSGLTKASVPVDAANTSASGIDPDISQANAEIQAHRVASVASSDGCSGQPAGFQLHPRPWPRVLRGAGSERAATEPRPRPSTGGH